MSPIDAIGQQRMSNMIPLKNPMNASTRLSMNGNSPMISTAPPFVLRLSKDERRVFQQNQISRLTPVMSSVNCWRWGMRCCKMCVSIDGGRKDGSTIAYP